MSGPAVVMVIALHQVLWALLSAALSLPVAYMIAMVALSWIHHGYVRVDPVHLRRITVSIALLVFAATFLLQRLH